MSPTSNLSFAHEFVLLWGDWKVDHLQQTYSTYCAKYQQRHTFTREELKDIDPRIVTVMDFCSKVENNYFYNIEQVLRNSYLVWERPQQTFEAPTRTIYWQAWVCLFENNPGYVELKVDAPLLVLPADDGTLIASATTGFVNVYMSWETFEKRAPGIQKHFNIGKALDMDAYDIAEYCEQMLFESPSIATNNASTMLPTTLTDNTQ